MLGAKVIERIMGKEGEPQNLDFCGEVIGKDWNKTTLFTEGNT